MPYGLLTAYHVLNPTLLDGAVSPSKFEYHAPVHTVDLRFAGSTVWKGDVNWLQPSRADIATVSSAVQWPMAVTRRPGMKWYNGAMTFPRVASLKFREVQCNGKSGSVLGTIYFLERSSNGCLLYIASTGNGIQPGDSGAVWYDSSDVIYAVQNSRVSPNMTEFSPPPGLPCVNVAIATLIHADMLDN